MIISLKLQFTITLNYTLILQDYKKIFRFKKLISKKFRNSLNIENFYNTRRKSQKIIKNFFIVFRNFLYRNFKSFFYSGKFLKIFKNS